MNNTPLVSIGIVLFHGEKYLPFSLSSLFQQSYQNIEFLIRDQSTNGEATEYIQNNIFSLPKNISFKTGENLLHSGGHNTLMRKMKGEYYVCASYDAVYDKNAIQYLVQILEENKDFSVAVPKLFHWDFAKVLNGKLQASKTDILDSAGMIVQKNHEAYDKGYGEADHGRYSVTKEVFGASGAFFMIRKTALQKIAFKNDQQKTEYFDELLHYKDDVDLFYRLRVAGEKCLFVPSAHAWHDRQISSIKKKNDFGKANSLFGHFVFLRKNFSWEYSLGTKLKVFWSIAKRLAYTVFFQRNVLKQYKKTLPEIVKKKEAMTRNISSSEMEKILDMK
jgi:GT2 family glycosyltransferase